MEHKAIFVRPLPRLVLNHMCDVLCVKRGGTLHMLVRNDG
jgi:hypothetical protein